MMITDMYIFGAAILIMLVSVVGVLSMNQLVGELIKKHLPYLISFSAGVFLFTAGFLVIESVHVLDNMAITAAAVVGGYLAAVLVSRLMPGFHHHHDEECAGHTRSGRRVLWGDAIHNTVDGLILVPAFMVSPWLGLGTAVSIFAHEFLQELSEFFVLRSSGYSVRTALLWNFVSSSTILVGVVLGYWLSDSLLVQGILLGLSAGFFVQIVFTDLLPTHGRVGGKQVLTHIGFLLLGLGLIAAVNLTLTHDHEHGDFEDHEKHTIDEEHEIDCTQVPVTTGPEQLEWQEHCSA